MAGSLLVLPLWLSLVLLCCNEVRGVTVAPMDPKMKEFLNAEHRLVVDLMKNYHKGIRPVHNQTDTVLVSLGLATISIVELNTNDDSIKMNCWVRYAWTDVRLKWDPTKYDGIDHFRILWSEIWRPDITLYNSAEPQTMYPTYEDTMAVISHDGSVLFIPHVFLKAMCAMDVTAFPYDTQQCVLKLGSWTFDGFKLDLDFFDGKETIDLSDLVMDNQWTVVKTGARKNIKRYPCCDEPYPDLTFNITVKRNGDGVIYCGPAVLLSFMIPLLFLMPHGTGDKTTLGFCIMLCLLVLLATLEGLLTTTRLPMLAYYYMFSFILVGVSLMITTLTNSIICGCTSTPPNVVFKAFSGVGRLLCVSAASMNTADKFALVDSEGENTPIPNARAKWIYMATVLDRIMFIIFVIIVTIITVTMNAKITSY